MTEPGVPDNSDDTAFEKMLKEEEEEEPEEVEIVTWSSILPPSSADS